MKMEAFRFAKQALMTTMVIKKGFEAAVSLPLTTYKGALFMMQFSQESGIQSVIDFAERFNCLIKALFHPLE